MLVFSLRRRSTIGIGEITEWLRYTESKGCPLHDLEEKIYDEWSEWSTCPYSDLIIDKNLGHRAD